jgi:hypothetical protein
VPPFAALRTLCARHNRRVDTWPSSSASLGYGVPADIRQLDLNGTNPQFLYFDQKSTVSLIVDQLCV